jgi:hypothetical protein
MSTSVAPTAAPTTGGYRLKGTLLEACTCDVLCPCWIGEDPDGGTCQSIMAYHLDSGAIDGVDVGGLSLAAVVFIPGNVLAGNWRQAVFVDDRATDEQERALLAAFGGALGGPLGDLAGLVGERLAVERAAISHEVVEGQGTIRIGADAAFAAMEPYRGPDGSVTTLNNSIFSTVPGSPAWVGKSSRFAVDLPEHGWTFQVEGRNAIQSDWAIEYRGNGA